MKRFTYKAKDKDGKVIIGEVEAQDLATGARLVRGKGFVVISIKPKSQTIIGFLNSFKGQIKSSDIANFTRQFATMINAGLPITESLSILKLQAQPKLEPIVAKILSDVENGESLSTAFGKHTTVFSPTYIALIKAGETGGVLDKVLLRIADNLEKAEEFKGKVAGALIYPIIIVIGMLIVGVIMMIFVIPRLLSLYTEFNADLPLPTKILIGFSNVVVQFWPIVLGLIVAGVFAFNSYIKTKAGRRKIDELTFKVPIFGQLHKK